MKLTKRALRGPVFEGEARLSRYARRLGNRRWRFRNCRCVRFIFVLDRGLERLIGGSVIGTLIDAVTGIGCRVIVLPVDSTLDDEGMSVSEFDVDVVLVDTRQFAVKVIAAVLLVDVETRAERAGGRYPALRALGTMYIVVIKQVEQGREATRRACEESHGAD